LSASPHEVNAFRHEALLYSGWADFVTVTVPFIREGLDAGESVLVVESPEKIDLLRVALDRDADRVLFADMAAVGANPARIIPAWRDFVTRSGAEGKHMRGIGEPIWNGRTADELIECQRHESLLNVAFGHGQPWWLLCPYDVSQLGQTVIEEAMRSHEYVTEAGGARHSDAFRGIEASGAPFDAALSSPAADARRLDFNSESLATLRSEVARFTISVGLPAARATDYVTAVNEVASNSLRHGGGSGSLVVWRDGDKVVSEVRDKGVYNQPLGDRVAPGSSVMDPRGLWLANQLCDLVQIRVLPGGTAVRLHMKIDPRHRLHVVPEEPPPTI
jgi:anti-sigma regulatory factor (Ser/Thr protein kinase)